MGRIIAFALLLTVLLAGADMTSAGSTAAPLSTVELKQIIGSGKKSTIVFFQNPMGGPCKAQKEILEKLHKERKGNFNIAYVSTMKEADQRAFYEYGIRNLPSLVLVDISGNISRVFPPGIQAAETLAAALDGVK
jgi:thioredoxin-like negative regulator of GroEL